MGADENRGVSQDEVIDMDTSKLTDKDNMV